MKKSAMIMLTWTIAFLFTGCGGGGGGGGGGETVSLTGNWDAIEFDTGSNPAWASYNVTLDKSGNIVVNNGKDSTGFILSEPINIMTKWEIDSSRTIREYDTSVTPKAINPSMYGTLAADQRLVVTTDSDPDSNTYLMMIARKRDSAVTYSNADIRGKTFALHQINNGADNTWEYGYGSIDALGNVSIDNVTMPSGQAPGYPQVNIDTILVDANGIVTNTDNSFYGLLTTDKSTLFALITEPLNSNPKNRLIVIQFTGQTYSQAELGGSWSFHTLFGDATPGWLRGTFEASPVTGVVTYNSLAYISNFGAAVPPTNETLTIGLTGTITDSLDPAFHGQMSFNKNLYVKTQSLYPPSAMRYSIGIVLK